MTRSLALSLSRSLSRSLCGGAHFLSPLVGVRGQTALSHLSLCKGLLLAEPSSSPSPPNPLLMGSSSVTPPTPLPLRTCNDGEGRGGDVLFSSSSFKTTHLFLMGLCRLLPPPPVIDRTKEEVTNSAHPLLWEEEETKELKKEGNDPDVSSSFLLFASNH